MTTSRTDLTPVAVNVLCTEDALEITLSDGRRLSVPLWWFPRLLRATPDQRARWELIGQGEGIHWPDVDEDLEVEHLFSYSLRPLPASAADWKPPRIEP
ncbi:MAG: DUF2442 domain-containing protein [Acidobacteria bacterium]|jgi:hypothetical protein|nr:DUF2442 domain-containing protein [Acidobacteriota bacterium]